MEPSLRFGALAAGYRSGRLSPVEVAQSVLDRIARRGQDHVWTSLLPREQLLQQARALAERRHEIDRLPLYGLPFGVKDNLDVAGLPTTCGCPGYDRQPMESAQAVLRAEAAGALLVGKLALDQFATGLNGTRTLGGHCRNVFDERVIPGGSSSGCGVAVAAGLLSFSLGSDTGGSGRVPAAMNNIVGLRPSTGRVGTRGLVFNNRLFDCIPVFAPTVEDAFTVLRCLADRPDGAAVEAPQRFRFAVPRPLEFFGDEAAAACFAAAVDRLRALGGESCEIDFEPFTEAGKLIFDSALVAERSASYGEVLDRCPDQLVPAVAAILERARRYSATDAFRAQYRMAELREEAARVLRSIDVLVTPTVPRPYTVAEMLADPLARNAEVGHYTYCVGPLDLCALAVPAGLRPDGVPHGISLVARAGEDGLLRSLGRRFEASVALPPGVEALA